MFSMKMTLNLCLIATLIFITGCMGDSTKKGEAVASSPEIVNRLIANSFTAGSFQSRSQSIITLSYTSLDSNLATSCSISQPGHIDVTQACSCDGMGVCAVGVTGVSAYSGAGSFAFNVVAGGKSSTTGSVNFTITPPPAGSNVPPVISSIGAKATNEGVAVSSVLFTISDSDSTVACTDVTATSSNTTLIPLASVVITGTAPNCYVTLTPAANLYGSSNIVLTLTDTGTPLPAQTATASFTVTVAGVNDSPTINSPGAQTTPEDTVKSGIAFTIADIDSTVTCADVTAVSSNLTLVSNGGVVIGGTAPNCTVAVTPNLNQSGTSNITLTLLDHGMPMPAKSSNVTFAMTVSAVNDAPVLSAIGTQTTDQNVAKNVAFTITDLESTLTCAGSVSITSSNTTLVPNANIVITGTVPNCNAAITPANNQNGTTTLTVLLTDSGTPLPAATDSEAVTFIVNQLNIAPTISAITAKTTNEDTVTAGIAFTIGDVDSTILCSNVTGASSNTALVPNGNIVITGTAPNCVATITPAANLNGVTNITLTVTDTGTPMPAQTATSLFTLTVTAVNDAPTISAITNKTTDEDTASSAIAFTIADVDSSVTCSGSVSAVSSNTTLIPNASVVVTGTVPNCNAVITPALNKNGTSTITLTVTDNGTPMPALTANTAFTMTVAPVADITGSLTVANNLHGVASSYSANSYARELDFTGLTSDEALTSVEVCLGTASGSCDVSSWVVATGYTTGGVAPAVTLGGRYRMKSGIGGAQVFTLSASCGVTTDYFYSVRATNSSSRISNIVSTPAWNFWEPTCLGGAVLTQWLDASEASTITVATGVSNWTDKSGNARTVTQATAGSQPAYSATGLGVGLPGVVFNGTSSNLMRNSFVYAQGSASIFTVINGPAIGANKYVFCEGRTASASNYYSPLVTSTSDTITGRSVNNAATSELNLPVTSTPFFDGTIRLAMAEDSGSTFYTYSDGVAQSQAATAYTRGASTINTYRLGARWRTAAESNWFAGTIGEFMVTYGVLTTTQRQKLEGYSAHKWNVNGNLQVAHPYSVSPP